MASQTNKISILIVGSTGKLGASITKHALTKPNLQVNILVRDPSKNPELVSQVQASGGKVIKGDLADPQTITNITQGMHTVISAISSYDEKIMVDGQIALIDDCIKNGVKRFVPSDFGVNRSHFTREELLVSFITANKIKVEDHFKKTSLPILRFDIGCFIETMVYVFKNGHAYWGDDIIHNFTTYDNVGRLVAAAVTRPDLLGKVSYSGSDNTVKEFQDIYNKVRGETVELKQAGSLEDLKKLAAAKQAQGEHIPGAFLALMVVAYDKRSRFDKLDNEKFPEVEATSLEDFFKQNLDAKL